MKNTVYILVVAFSTLVIAEFVTNTILNGSGFASLVGVITSMVYAAYMIHVKFFKNN